MELSVSIRPRVTARVIVNVDVHETEPREGWSDVKAVEAK
jgi:hypothetical protein